MIIVSSLSKDLASACVVYCRPCAAKLKTLAGPGFYLICVCRALSRPECYAPSCKMIWSSFSKQCMYLSPMRLQNLINNTESSARLLHPCLNLWEVCLFYFRMGFVFYTHHMFSLKPNQSSHAGHSRHQPLGSGQVYRWKTPGMVSQ